MSRGISPPRPPVKTLFDERMNEQKMCLIAAEIVQLKVVRTSSSNSTGVYERVQKSQPPFYHTVDANPVSKPEGDYVYAYANKPRKQLSGPTTADGGTLRVLTPHWPPSEDDWNNDGGSRRSRYASLPLPPPPLPDREPAKFNIGLALHSQSLTVGVDGSEDEKPVPPPRRRNTSDSVNSRRKQPPPPPDQPACLEVPEPHSRDEDPTAPSAGRRTVTEQQPTAAIRCPTDPEDVPEDVREPLSLTKQSQSQDDNDDDAETPMTEPGPRNPVDPVYSHQQPVPPPDQSVDEYLEVREPLVAVTQPDAGQPVEELSPQLMAAFCDQMSVDEIADCLRQMNLHNHVDAFRRNDVDGALMSKITEDMLTDDFAMSRFEAKKLMMFVKEGWRPKITDS